MIGTIYKSRKGAEYRVVATDAKGFVVQRAGNPSQCRITFSKVAKAKKLLASQGFLAFQSSPANGGISYTVAVDASIAGYLGLIEGPKGWMRSEDA